MLKLFTVISRWITQVGRWKFPFLHPSPPPPHPPSHSNHQLERLFIDPLLPSASSSPLSTTIVFLYCSLPPFVSRAVGQHRHDVTGTEIVRRRSMRVVGLKSWGDRSESMKKTDTRDGDAGKWLCVRGAPVVQSYCQTVRTCLPFGDKSTHHVNHIIIRSRFD